MALAVGSRIAHYHVTALIGEGGMGTGLSSERYQARLGRGVGLPRLAEMARSQPLLKGGHHGILKTDDS